MEQLDPCKVLLNIEVDAQEVERAIDRAYREFNRTMEIPGFRKGKVPRPILERYVRPDSLYRRAIDHLVPTAYAQALQETGVRPYDHPDLELVALERNKPFAFKAIVPLPPRVELGEYQGLKVVRRHIPVSDEDVENEIRRLQERQARTERVEGRGVRMDDQVLAEISSWVEGDEDAGTESRLNLVQIGQNLPAFDQALLGAVPGDQREVVVPPDEEGSGPVHMRVKIREIRKKILPEVNDEFAKNIGGAETLSELRDNIRKELEEHAARIAQMEMESRLVEAIIENSTLHFPDIMVEHEVEEDLEELRRELDRRSLSMEDYLEGVGKSEAAIREEMAERARRRIRTGLVLGEIARREEIAVAPEEIEKHIEEMAAESQVPTETFRQYLQAQEDAFDSLKNRLLRDKILAFLTEKAQVEQEEASSG